GRRFDLLVGRGRRLGFGKVPLAAHTGAALAVIGAQAGVKLRAGPGPSHREMGVEVDDGLREPDHRIPPGWSRRPSLPIIADVHMLSGEGSHDVQRCPDTGRQYTTPA